MQGSSSGADRAWAARLLLFALLSALISFAVFLPALQGGFLNWDDNTYVTANAYLRPPDAQFVSWAFRAMRGSNWHPLTW